MIIEGENSQENEKYKKIALSAIENIKYQMKTMVKYIQNPPVLISMKPEDLSEEKLLLWTLGLDEYPTNTCAAVFYGRAKWIGPLMKTEEINETNLMNILSVIGLDCECELDISWVSGTLLPVKWDQKSQAQAARLLGFDPENPYVKLEVNRILKMGSSSYPGVPVMYADSTMKSDLDYDGYIVDDNKPYWNVKLYIILGFVTIIILIIVWTYIFLFHKRRKNNN